jgi:hypothetical protein
MSEDITPKKELNKTEASRLAALERVISRGLRRFVEVGASLAEIQASGLYRAKHATFEAYCRDRWDIGKTYAYNLIASARVVENISSIADHEPLPTNEAQVRELAKLDPEAQKQVWIKTLEHTGGKVTALEVKRTVAQVVTMTQEQEQFVKLERKERGWEVTLRREWPIAYHSILDLVPKAERMKAEHWIWNWIDERRWEFAKVAKRAA